MQSWYRAAKLVLVLLITYASLGASAGFAATRPSVLGLGFNDVFVNSDQALTNSFGQMKSLTAIGARTQVVWATIAPHRPPTAEDAVSGVWSGYNFEAVDNTVRLQKGAGLEPLLVVYGAPPWAEGPDRPAQVRVGSWMPNDVEFGRFMQAIADRYDGNTPDPSRPGQSLPRVSKFQIWNEPNLVIAIAPQWIDRKPAAPRIYRALLNSGYEGVKRAQPSAKVIGAGTAPFGEPYVGGWRMQPASFWRSVFCLNAKFKRVCRQEVKLDVFAHHPYPIGSPGNISRYKDDIVPTGMGRLVQVVKAAKRVGNLGPSRPPIWVTEFGYQTSPPIRAQINPGLQARWAQESLWRLWAQGVSRVYWFQVQDPANADGKNIPAMGVFDKNGRRKPGASALRFPVVVTKTAGSTHTVWLNSPSSGRVVIQVYRAGRWVSIKSITARRQRPRLIKITAANVKYVRALRGKTKSASWGV